MRQPQACIALFARVPVVGKVKTRLIPALGAEGACQLHERLLARILGVLQQQTLGAAELWLDTRDSHPLVDACPLPRQLQQGCDLGERMANAVDATLQRYQQVLVIGSDTPTLDADYLQQALAALDAGYDVVLGPAFDGGYVLIGCSTPHACMFEDIEWGTAQVLQQTLARLAAAGLRCHLLNARPDVDGPADLRFIS